MQGTVRQFIMQPPANQLLDLATVIHVAQVLEPATAKRAIIELHERGWFDMGNCESLIDILGLEAA